MAQVTLEKVLTEAKELSANEQRLLRAWLEAELRQTENVRSIEELAREQGKRPVSFQELLGPEPSENDDDDVDEFLRDRRQTHTAAAAQELDEGVKSLAQLMQEQGTRPLTFAAMRGDFWPAEDDVDDFVRTVRQWRQETTTRSLAE